MRMGGININLLLLIISLSFSVVIGKSNYFEEYFSKYPHHHKSSLTAPSVSSIPEISKSEILISSSQNDNETGALASDIENDDNETDLPESDIENGSSSDEGTNVFIIVGNIAIVILVLGCIVCCCRRCRRTQSSGFIVGSAVPLQQSVTNVAPVQSVTVVVPPQSATSPAPPQPEIVQNQPQGYALKPVQQFPPQYQQPTSPPMQYPPMQQPGFQYSPMQQPAQYSPVQPQTQYSPVQPQTQYSPVQPHSQYSQVQPQTQYSPVHPCYQNTATSQFQNPPKAPPPYGASHQ